MTHSWDDYRIFSAVAEAGSLYQAAKKLKVNHTTVLRRISALETKLKVRLFDRSREGYSLTAAGEQLYEEVKGVAEHVDNAERRILGRDVTLKGTVRVAASDTVGLYLLPPLLRKFRQFYPEIHIELIISSQLYDLTKREADVAIRVTNNPPAHWYGRKLKDLTMAVMANKTLANQSASVSELLEQVGWIVGIEYLSQHPVSCWIREHVKEEHITFGANSMVGIAHAIQQGLGHGIIPQYLTSFLPELVMLHPIEELASELWVLTHEDLRNTARVKAFTTFVQEMIK